MIGRLKNSGSHLCGRGGLRHWIPSVSDRTTEILNLICVEDWRFPFSNIKSQGNLFTLVLPAHIWNPTIFIHDCVCHSLFQVVTKPREGKEIPSGLWHPTFAQVSPIPNVKSCIFNRSEGPFLFSWALSLREKLVKKINPRLWIPQILFILYYKENLLIVDSTKFWKMYSPENVKWGSPRKWLKFGDNLLQK